MPSIPLRHHPFPFDRNWPLHQAAQMACILEAAAPKVGNVHPGAAFDDMQFGHFVASGLAMGEVFQNVQAKSVGDLVLDAVNATRRAVDCNTNLGSLLLLAPLAKAASGDPATDFPTRVSQVLSGLTRRDSQLVYQAIRMAGPGGMGQRQQHDLSGDAPDDLIAAMAIVADMDAVARQYARNYVDVFENLIPWLRDELSLGFDMLDALCRLQIRWLAHEPDGLIIRKLGSEAGREVQRRAQAVWPDVASYSGRVAELSSVEALDTYLRAAGHQRNPGTTADLIAATIFACLVVA